MSDVQEKLSGAEVTKQGYRKKVWDHITKNEFASFPLSVYSRIPNFKGAAEAAQRLLDLEEFKQAKTVKINPDKPQEPVRFLALEANKEILVPIPRLKSGLFLHVTPSAGATKEELKNIATRRGLQDSGKPLGLDSKIKVDLVVLGAVCVSRSGHRIGKGEGFADLEFAVMLKMGAVDENTTVVTTVHDSQIVDDLPGHLFEKFDVPVDIIVTPTQTIIVSEKLKKPSAIYWDILTPRRVKSMQILQELQQIAEKEGEIVTLKEEDSSDERRRFERTWVKRIKSKRRPRRRRDEDSDAVGIRKNSEAIVIRKDSDAIVIRKDSDAVSNRKDAEPKEIKERDVKRSSRAPRRRRLHEPKGGGDHESPSNDNETLANPKEKPRRRKSIKPRTKTNIDFSLKLSNIKSDVRVRHLKNALAERGIRASDITWHGQKGYCYLHFGKLRNKDAQPDQPVQVDSIVANLQQLRLGDTIDTENDEFILVEPAKPITRIEITDVTAV